MYYKIVKEIQVNGVSKLVSPSNNLLKSMLVEYNLYRWSYPHYLTNYLFCIEGHDNAVKFYRQYADDSLKLFECDVKEPKRLLWYYWDYRAYYAQCVSLRWLIENKIPIPKPNCFMGYGNVGVSSLKLVKEVKVELDYSYISKIVLGEVK